MARLKRLFEGQGTEGAFPGKLRQLKAQRMQLKRLKHKLKVFWQKVNNAKLTFCLSTGSEKCLYILFLFFIFWGFLVWWQAQQVAAAKTRESKIENDSCSYFVRQS